MRVALGAGALAAVSVLAVGMVKPDFGGSDDQATTSDSELDGTLATTTDAPGGKRRVRVRHITEYVFLQPGEKAPRGATVISSSRLIGGDDSEDRPEGTRQQPEAQSNANAPRSNTTAPRNDTTPRSNPAPNPQPEPQADRQPPPRRDPAPVTTRQSG